MPDTTACGIHVPILAVHPQALSWASDVRARRAASEYGCDVLGVEASSKAIERNGKTEPNQEYQQAARTCAPDGDGNVHASLGNGEIYGSTT